MNMQSIVLGSILIFLEPYIIMLKRHPYTLSIWRKVFFLFTTYKVSFPTSCEVHSLYTHTHTHKELAIKFLYRLSAQVLRCF